MHSTRKNITNWPCNHKIVGKILKIYWIVVWSGYCGREAVCRTDDKPFLPTPGDEVAWTKTRHIRTLDRSSAKNYLRMYAFIHIKKYRANYSFYIHYCSTTYWCAACLTVWMFYSVYKNKYKLKNIHLTRTSFDI